MEWLSFELIYGSFVICLWLWWIYRMIVRFIKQRSAGNIEFIVKPARRIFVNTILGIFTVGVTLLIGLSGLQPSMNNNDKIGQLCAFGFYLLLTVSHFITAYTTMKIRKKGIVTWDRFIKWDEISEIDDKKDGATHQNILILLKDRKWFKKVKINTRDYEISDDVVEELKSRIGK